MLNTIKWNNIRNILLFLSIIFTSLKALRFDFIPIGFGEIFGFFYILLNLSYLLKKQCIYIENFYLIIIYGIIIGLLSNILFGYVSTIKFYDLIAISYAMLFSVSLFINIIEKPYTFKVFIFSLCFVILIHIIPLILIFFGVQLDSWMTEEGEPGIPFLTRYQGLANNPNQLGLYLSGLPILIFVMIQQFKNCIIEYIFIAITFIFALVMLFLVKSSTTMITYILSAYVIVLFNIKKKIIRFLYFFFTPFILAVTYLNFIVDEVNKNDSDDANGRFPLWRNAIDGADISFYMGAGPGAHSGSSRPFQGVEAHNGFLDLLLQGGIISLVGYVSLFFYVFFLSLKSKNYLAMGLGGVILIQQFSHFLLRHPIFWVYLLCSIALAKYLSRMQKLNQ